MLITRRRRMGGPVNLPHSIKSHPESHQSKITCTSLVLMNFRLPGQFHTISAGAPATTQQKRKGFSGNNGFIYFRIQNTWLLNKPYSIVLLLVLLRLPFFIRGAIDVAVFFFFFFSGGLANG